MKDRQMKKIFMIGMVFASFTVSSFAVQTGEVLTQVTLAGKNGGLNDDKVWDSLQLKGKVHVLLYMDPDERKEAMPFLNKLNKAGFPSTNYSTVAIVNLAATWMPNMLLETMLDKKQKELLNTQFVFDKTKHLVKKWQMKDDASNILVLDKEMKVLYKKSGTLSTQDQKEILDLVKNTLKK